MTTATLPPCDKALSLFINSAIYLLGPLIAFRDINNFLFVQSRAEEFNFCQMRFTPNVLMSHTKLDIPVGIRTSIGFHDIQFS